MHICTLYMHFKFSIILLICLFLTMVGLSCCLGFSLSGESGGDSLVAVVCFSLQGLLVAEPRFASLSNCGSGTHYLQLPGSGAQAQ